MKLPLRVSGGEETVLGVDVVVAAPVVLQWCHSGVTVLYIEVLQWCSSGVIVVLLGLEGHLGVELTQALEHLPHVTTISGQGCSSCVRWVHCNHLFLT
jgi:hypothetical protein